MTPAVTADSSTNRRSAAVATRWASVVLPVPGGPQMIADSGPAAPPDPSISRRSGLPGRSTLRLAAHLVEGARAHPDGERGDAGRRPAGRRARRRRPPRTGPRVLFDITVEGYPRAEPLTLPGPAAASPGRLWPRLGRGSSRGHPRPRGVGGLGRRSPSRASPSRSAGSPASRCSSACTRGAADRRVEAAGAARTHRRETARPAQTLTLQVAGADLGRPGRGRGRRRPRTQDLAARPGRQLVHVAAPRCPAVSRTRGRRRSSRAAARPAGGFVTVVDFEPGLDEDAQDRRRGGGRAAAAAIVAACPGAHRLGRQARAAGHAITHQIERDLRAGRGHRPAPDASSSWSSSSAGSSRPGCRSSVPSWRSAAALLSLFGFSHLDRPRRDRRQHRHPARARTLDRLRAAHGEPVPRGARDAGEHRVPTRATRVGAGHRAHRRDRRPHRRCSRGSPSRSPSPACWSSRPRSCAPSASPASRVVLVAMVVAHHPGPGACASSAPNACARKAVEPAVRRRRLLPPRRRRAAPAGRRHRRRRGRARDPRAADPVDAATSSGTELLPEGRAAAGLLRAARPRLPRALRPRGHRRRRARPTGRRDGVGRSGSADRPGVEGVDRSSPSAHDHQRVDVRVAGRPDLGRGAGRSSTRSARTDAAFETLTSPGRRPARSTSSSPCRPARRMPSGSSCSARSCCSSS